MRFKMSWLLIVGISCFSVIGCSTIAYAPVHIRPLDADYYPGEPLKLNYQNYSTVSRGDGHCLIFRPENIDISHGKRYFVEVFFSDKTDKLPNETNIQYLVEFVDL